MHGLVGVNSATPIRHMLICFFFLTHIIDMSAFHFFFFLLLMLVTTTLQRMLSVIITTTVFVYTCCCGCSLVYERYRIKEGEKKKENTMLRTNALAVNKCQCHEASPFLFFFFCQFFFFSFSFSFVVSANKDKEQRKIIIIKNKRTCN